MVLLSMIYSACAVFYLMHFILYTNYSNFCYTGVAKTYNYIGNFNTILHSHIFITV